MIETAFQTMHTWGRNALMVRSWQAIERLLPILACAYLLSILLLTQGAYRTFRLQAIRLLRRLTVPGRRLTAGKIAQALGLDCAAHAPDWRAFASP